jgi:hypothetical protein
MAAAAVYPLVIYISISGASNKRFDDDAVRTLKNIYTQCCLYFVCVSHLSFLLHMWQGKLREGCGKMYRVCTTSIALLEPGGYGVAVLGGYIPGSSGYHLGIIHSKPLDIGLCDIRINILTLNFQT